jgi:hypothetical protein
MRTVTTVLALVAGIFAGFVLLDLVNVLVFARSAIGAGEIGWRVAVVLAGLAFSATTLARHRSS